MRSVASRPGRGTEEKKMDSYDFPAIAGKFAAEGEYVSCVRYGEGHINDTFCLTMAQGGRRVRYIL